MYIYVYVYIYTYIYIYKNESLNENKYVLFLLDRSWGIMNFDGILLFHRIVFNRRFRIEKVRVVGVGVLRDVLLSVAGRYLLRITILLCV